MKCRLCGSNKHKEHYYADIIFNGKVFTYNKCMSCGAVNVFPDPDPVDLGKMYGEIDHSYLTTIEKLEYNYNYSKSSHQSIQLLFLEKSGLLLKNKTLLDFACGSGFYMKYAEKMGASVVGIEFDETFAKMITGKSGMTVLSLPMFKEVFHNRTFDYIHFGHILEHMPDPSIIMEELNSFAHSETIYIFDGPLDKNTCVSRLLIDLGTRILRRKEKHYPPQHLSLSTTKSQKNFFHKNGFKIQKFKVREQRKTISNNNRTFKYKFLDIISRLSIFVSSLIPGWGNVFHCCAIKT